MVLHEISIFEVDGSSQAFPMTKKSHLAKIIFIHIFV